MLLANQEKAKAREKAKVVEDATHAKDVEKMAAAELTNATQRWELENELLKKLSNFQNNQRGANKRNNGKGRVQKTKGKDGKEKVTLKL